MRMFWSQPSMALSSHQSLKFLKLGLFNLNSYFTPKSFDATYTVGLWNISLTKISLLHFVSKDLCKIFNIQGSNNSTRMGKGHFGVCDSIS